ncbi:NAD(P)/FAD-dependent oxidoreductase [Miltoncostaea marina]|uniref:NAD(P)/FAD-dependent oxidoreductase n=1 Tax=Miltoncostaea marina TaxID=2843215 RepID=UPI001C3D22B1|nr:NAD(P)/FAD-dependent oxidoreductase [Miltoncostaea marina]
MTDSPGAPMLDCIVVGGGLAGLACAHGLVSAGRSVHVLEAEEAPGGRARTVWHRGRPVDRGVALLLRAYPRTARLLKDVDLPRRDLRPVAGGFVVVGPDGAPARLRSARGAGLARFPGLTPGDRARVARLVASVATRPAEVLLAQDDDAPTAEDLLRGEGLSEAAIEGLFRPLFAALTLDRALAADPGWFRWLLSMLVRGGVAIPSDGMGMIAEWTSAAVRQAGGAVDVAAPVTALEPDAAGRRVAAVVTADGRRLQARRVVLAVDAPAARRLLEGLDDAAAARLPREAASAVTAAFAMRRPLYSGRSVVLNGAPGGPGAPGVDVLCQTTNITRPDAPDGPHILLATRITTGGAPADGLVEAVGELVGRWAPRFDWRGLAEPIGVYEHAHAMPRPLAGVRRDPPGPRTRLDNLVLAGDATAHGSIEGAIESGARAAGIVDALLP